MWNSSGFVEIRILFAKGQQGLRNLQYEKCVGYNEMRYVKMYGYHASILCLN